MKKIDTEECHRFIKKYICSTVSTRSNLQGISKSLISIELSIKIIQKQDRLTGKLFVSLKKQLLASFLPYEK